MLGKRTKNLIDRIERNIKIGFVVMAVLILIIAFDDFILSPMMMEDLNLAIPDWLLFLGVFSNTLIFTTFLYFVVKYYRVKQACDLALASLTITMALGFITGLYQESMAELERQGTPFSEIQFDQLFLEIIIGVAILIGGVGGIFLFLRWGFRRLYGNYYLKLKRTLKELEEIED